MLNINEWFDLFKEELKRCSKAEIVDLLQLIFECLDNEDTMMIPLEKNKYKIIHFEDILFIIEEKGHITIRTLEKSYAYHNEVSDIFDFLQAKHKVFKMINNNVMVNINHVKAYDSYLRRVYFSDYIFIDSTGIAIKNIKKYFGTSYDLNKETLSTVGEYYPKTFKKGESDSTNCDIKA